MTSNDGRKPPTGIPTSYGGVDFRSRVEARWAAFFDLVKWPWDYEPLDLEYYIPDFLLHFDHGDVLFECKGDRALCDLVRHAKKIQRSGWRHDFVIVGECLLSPRTAPGQTSLGVMGQWLGGPEGDGESLIGEALVHTCAACSRVSFHHDDGARRCVACGAEGRALVPTDRRWIDLAWREAGNKVQWMPTGDR